MDLCTTLETVKSVFKDTSPSDFVEMEILEKIEIVHPRLKEKNLIPPLLLEMKSDEITQHTLMFLDGVSIPFVGNINKYNYAIAYAETNQVKSRLLYERAKYLFKHRLYNEFDADVNRALTMDSLADNQAEIRTLKKQAARLKKVYNRPYGKFYQDPPNINEINPIIPSASSSIKIAIDDINGKHIVATKNIKAGEVLVVEKPFAATCETAQLPLICHECFQRCYNLLPCDNCAHRFYCSDACKTTAWNTCHKYLCPLMKSLNLICKMCPGTLLALEITIKNRGEYRSLDDDEYEHVDVDNVYSSTSFRSVWKSAGKLEDVQYEKQIFSAYLTVVFYEWLITYTDFFDDFQATINKESFMTVLFTMLCLDKYFTIGCISGTAFDHSQYKQIGQGLYLVGSHFSHSCCPNIYQTFHGSTVVMRAIRAIKAGEVCCISYSFNHLYYMSNKDFRQRELTNSFQLKCQCEACVKNWPMLNIHQNEPWLRFGYLIPPNFLKGNVEAAKTTLQRLLEKFENFELKEPDKDVILLQCLIRVCFRIFGNNNCALNDI